jgi:hypothetical protein
VPIPYTGQPDEPLETPFEDPLNLALMSSPMLRFGVSPLMRVLSAGFLNAGNIGLQTRLTENRPISGIETLLSALGGSLLGSREARPIAEAIEAKASSQGQAIYRKLAMNRVNRALTQTEGIPVSRIDKIPTNPKMADIKPHGLYFSFGHSPKASIYRGYWPKFNEQFLGIVKSKKPLKVEPHSLDLFNDYYNDFEYVSPSAGVLAAKALLPKSKFERLLKIDKHQLSREIAQKFPTIERVYPGKRWKMLDIYGAQLAKKKGYDAIMSISKLAPEESEIAVLSSKALRGK